MKNKSVVNNIQSFILLINKFLSMLILMCKMGQIFLFILECGWSLNFWPKYQIFKNSLVKKNN